MDCCVYVTVSNFYENKHLLIIMCSIIALAYVGVGIFFIKESYSASSCSRYDH